MAAYGTEICAEGFDRGVRVACGALCAGIQEASAFQTFVALVEIRPLQTCRPSRYRPECPAECRLQHLAEGALATAANFRIPPILWKN